MKLKATIILLAAALLLHSGLETAFAYAGKAVTVVPNAAGACSLGFSADNEAPLYTYSCRLLFDIDKLAITEVTPKLFSWDEKSDSPGNTVYRKDGRLAGMVFLQPDAGGAKLILTALGREGQTEREIADVRFSCADAAAVFVTEESCAAIGDGVCYELPGERIWCGYGETAAAAMEFDVGSDIYGNESFGKEGAEKITVSLAQESDNVEIKEDLCVLKPESGASEQEAFAIFFVGADGARNVTQYILSEDGGSVWMKAGGYGDYYLKKVRLSFGGGENREVSRAAGKLVGAGILSWDADMDAPVSFLEAYGAVRAVRNSRCFNLAEAGEIRALDRRLSQMGKRAEETAGPVSRGEFAALLVEEGFAAGAGDGAAPIARLRQYGIILGDENGDLMPAAELTRAQMAVILDRTVKNELFGGKGI